MNNNSTKEKKHRVLMIAPLPPPVHGSAMMTKFVKDSSRINDALDLDWVNLSTSRSMSEIGKKSPIKIVRFFGAYIKTLYKLSVHKYDACYLAITCHGLGFLKDLPFVILCKIFRNSIIIHQHNKGMSRDVNKSIFRFLFKRAYKDAKVVLLSNRLYHDIEEIVDDRQVTICPNGIPEIDLLAKEETGIPRLLFLSNLIINKGVLVLLDACEILKDRGCKFTCVFIGNPTGELSKEKFQSEISRRNLDEFVEYLGPKYGLDKTQEIRNSDIFVFPTYYDNECFPVVLLEAMQQAVPVVSTQEGGIPDIVTAGENGFVVPPQDSESLADKLELLINDREMRIRMGESGYQKYRNQFTLPIFEDKMLDILSK